MKTKRAGSVRFDDSGVAGSWSGLVVRLDRGGALERWAVVEPPLRGIGSVAKLAAVLRDGCTPQRRDELLGALLRTASARGGNDLDAVLVLLHLLSPGIENLAHGLCDLTADPVALLAGQLTLQIRTYGEGVRGGLRQRALAANLLSDARRAALRELRPHATPERPGGADVLVDPTNARWVAAVLDEPVWSRWDRAGLDLGDVLTWAAWSQVVTPADLAALLDAECSRERGVGAPGQARVAARLGVHPSTLRRRRTRALTALRAARADYLDRWVAA